MSKLTKRLSFLLLTLFFVGLFSVLFAKPVAAAPKCALGHGLVDCSQFNAHIEEAGYDPNDSTKCYFISAEGVAAENCNNALYGGANQPPNNETERRIVVQSEAQLDDAINDPDGGGRVDCNSPESCVDNNPLVWIIVLVTNILSAIVGVVVVAVIIIAGIQYSSAGGDPNKTVAAKNRIVNAIIALVAYIFLYALLNWLLPGGLF